MKSLLFVLCLAANVYLLGAMLIFALVTYPQLGATPAPGFTSAYAAFNAGIGLPVVSVEFGAALLTLALYAARPDAVPLWAVHVLVARTVAYFAITFGWHLPAHRALAAGDNSAAAMAPLLSSQWARTAVQFLRAALLLWLGVRAMRS